MKKILILLIMLMISSIAFAGNYNPETQEITTNLQKGWNLIPVNIIHADIGYAVDTCPLKYSYVYDPVSKSYWSEEYSNGVEHMNSYSYNLVSRSSIDLTYSTNPLFGVAWVYSETTCELNTLFGRSYESAPNPWTNELKSNLEDKLRLVSGWNFITINPFMIGLNTKDIFQNCSVEKAATWDNMNQSWYYTAVSGTNPTAFADNITNGNYPLNSTTVGNVFVIKTTNECTLNYGSELSGPPALPEDDPVENPINSAKQTWKTAEPFGIADWSKTGDNFSIILKNNSFETLTLKSVQVSPNDYRLALTELVAPGAVVRVDISSENCPTGEEYTYSKSEISLTYDSENIQGKRKFGVADLSGMCN